MEDNKFFQNVYIFFDLKKKKLFEDVILKSSVDLTSTLTIYICLDFSQAWLFKCST